MTSQQPIDTPDLHWKIAFYESELCTLTITTLRIKHAKNTSTLQPSVKKAEGTERSFTIYRAEVIRLLAHPKPSHDQVALELMALMGFRASECTTLRLEHCDFAHEECLVLDAKKHKLMTVILARSTARHIMECSRGRIEGLVVENLSTAWRGRNKPLSGEAIWYLVRRCAENAHSYPSPREYSPLVLRRFYIAATLEARKDEPLPFVLIDIMKQVRHSDPRALWEYALKIRFKEDWQRGFNKFQNRMEKMMCDSVPRQETIKVKT